MIVEADFKHSVSPPERRGL